MAGPRGARLTRPGTGALIDLTLVLNEVERELPEGFLDPGLGVRRRRMQDLRHSHSATRLAVASRETPQKSSPKKMNLRVPLTENGVAS
jgi:hypothetical protein